MMKTFLRGVVTCVASALVASATLASAALAGPPASNDKGALMREGNRLAGRGDYKGAAAQFEKAAALAPNDANIFFNLGQIYEQSNPAKCILRYNRFLQLEADSADAPAARTAMTTCTNKLKSAGAIHITDLVPANNVITIDGVAVTEGPSVLAMAPGEYRIRVEALDHDPFDQKVTIVAGQTSEVAIKLVPQVTFGTMTIKVNRPGATITIDGQPAGVAPLAAPIRLASGKHLVVIEAEGFHKWQRNVTIEKDIDEEVEARLQAASVNAR